MSDDSAPFALWLRRAVLGCAALALVACSSVPTPAIRTAIAESQVDKAGWHANVIEAQSYRIWSAGPAPEKTAAAEVLNIMIEGDGLAWLNQHTPSLDPTPINAEGLRLALTIPGNVVYLARPCQFVMSDACTQSDWTEARFHPRLVAVMNAAIDQLKAEYGAKQVKLAGYSGGGVMAALIAARRADVAGLTTIAANLDTAAWVRHHGLTPLTGSLNPADDWAALTTIPQRHYVGADDTTVPFSIAHAYAARFPSNAKPEIIIEHGQGHEGWQWPAANAQSQ
ncbi:MAG: alpha/beta fold hydrolase [Rickettsiales bacterium]